MEEDYFRMNLLCNEGARNQLLSSIKPAFQRRMDLINSFVYRSVSVSDYEIALEYLDDLIEKLFSGKSGAPNEAVENRSTTCSYPDEVLKFYKDLVSVRNILVPKRTDGLPSDVLYFDQSPICACVVSRMEKILNKYKRPVSAEIATEFLGYYKEYLCLQIDPDKRDKAVNFAKTYNRLSEYIHGDLSVDVFIEEMRNELYSYAKSIFVELRKISLYGFVHTEYTPKAANDAHFRKRLVDTQYAIQKNIDEAIKQLKMAYTIFYYSTQISDEGISIVSLPPMGQAEMDRLSDCMYYQIYALSGTVQGMPEIAFDKIAQYVDTYNALVVPMMECEKISTNELDELLTQMRSIKPSDSDRWLATSKFLEYQCKVAVALMVDDSVKKLADEYVYFCSLINDAN